MTISLPEPLQAAARLLASQAGFKTTDEYIAELVRRDLEAQQQKLGQQPKESPEEWQRSFAAWMQEVQGRASRYPPGFVLDDSRESIYAEREK
jgi:hypothetical protein